MKVCIHLRDPVNGDLNNDNLRGESRWERQVLGALLQNELVTEVYSSGNIWRSPSDSKYKGIVQSSDDVIFIGHDWFRSGLGCI